MRRSLREAAATGEQSQADSFFLGSDTAANTGLPFQIRWPLKCSFRDPFTGLQTTQTSLQIETHDRSRVRCPPRSPQHWTGSLPHPTPTHSLSFTATKDHSASRSWRNYFYRFLPQFLRSIIPEATLLCKRQPHSEPMLLVSGFDSLNVRFSKVVKYATHSVL